MKKVSKSYGFRTLAVLLLPATCAVLAGCQATDPLPSWNDTAPKHEIMSFVQDVTRRGGAHYVPPAERIATFDNDGTLWTEYPVYTQLLFALDRIEAMSAKHPEWKNQEPFKSALARDMKGVMAGGEEALLELVAVSHTGMTTDEFEIIVEEWIATAEHPKFKRKYTQLTYQPMLELLDYLRDNSFKTYIVSGGGVEFMRPFTEDAYGIPPEQVIGSSVVTRFEVRDDKPVLVREPKIFHNDDKEGKPIGIQKFIGRRPIAAFGNSDGDLQMVQWTTAGDGRRLGAFVRHTDGQREGAYDRESHVGRLNRALDLADENGWIIIDMKRDWNRVWPE